MPAAALLVVVEPEPELVVLEPEVDEEVGELMVKVPLVLELEPVPTGVTAVPAGGGTTTRVVLAGSVAAAGWVVTGAG